jgi:hypothetical protein
MAESLAPLLGLGVAGYAGPMGHRSLALTYWAVVILLALLVTLLSQH